MVCLKPTPEGKTHIIIESFDDPKMTLPNWYRRPYLLSFNVSSDVYTLISRLFNWLTTHGMKKFLDTVEREAKNYELMRALPVQSEGNQDQASISLIKSDEDATEDRHQSTQEAVTVEVPDTETRPIVM